MNLDINMKQITDIILFDKEIKADIIEAVLDGIQRVVMQVPDAKILIYFSSQGGSLAHADLLLNYFNALSDNIILRAFHQISSAAFKVFFEFEGQKDIMDNTFAIIHKGSKSLIARDLDNKESFDFFMTNKVIPNMNCQTMNLFNKVGLTKKELDMVKHGKDIFLDTKRLRKMIDKNLSK
jgi:ATP-dependent protease ClpP protease subunit